MQKLKTVLLIGVFIMLSFGCSRQPQHFEEHEGKWVITGLPKGTPKYSFEPLGLSWKPHFPPTDNCALFFGKIGEGTHIGVFLHPIKPGEEPEHLPKELMSDYLSSNDHDNRSVIILPRPFGNGIYAACENNFNSIGAKVRAFEAFIIIPTSHHLIGFTFKRRMEVDSWDFRKEKGKKILENEVKKQLEHEEFLTFVRGFSVDKVYSPKVMIGRTTPVTSTPPNRAPSLIDGRWYVMGYISKNHPEFGRRPDPMGGPGPFFDVTHERISYWNEIDLMGTQTTGTVKNGTPWLKVVGEKAEAHLYLRDSRLIVEVISTDNIQGKAYIFRSICRERTDYEQQMKNTRGWILNELDAVEKLARYLWNDLP